MTRLRFEPLYYGDRLRLVNPFGDVGIVTLWTPLRTAVRLLTESVPDILDPERSRVVALSNLYGDGMYAMLCNLLYNPQVRHIVAIGEDLGLPMCEEIAAFIAEGCEDAVLLGRPLRRVRGTGRLFPADPEFDEDALRARLTFRHVGRISGRDAGRALRDHLAALPTAPEPDEADRVRVPIEMWVPDGYAFRPSDVGGHQVVRRRPLDAWEEVVVRVARFGRPVLIGGEPRLELLNVKVVVTEPAAEPAEALEAYGFRLERFHEYQRKMLDPELPPQVSYTYGNRLRGYFALGEGRDSLAVVADVLRVDPSSRRAYVALWDTANDLGPVSTDDARALPCLTTLWFRISDDRLTMSATYRSHNLLVAWLQNVYGLMAVQQHVAGLLGIDPGALTVLSNSLGIDPRSPSYATAQALVEQWDTDDDIDRDTGRHSLREDPNGYFVVTVDESDGTIVAEHRYGGLLVKEYRADRAAKIERAVAADMAVSVVSHALWLGRELATKERLLRARAERDHG